MEVIQAWVLDGAGGAREVEGEVVTAAGPPDGLLWAHLDYEEPSVQAWLRGASGLHEIAAEALLAEEPRPRSLVVGDGLVVILRGINTTQGADPEDMVSLRMWLERGRVLTLRHRRVRAVDETMDELEAGRGPRDAGEVLHDVTERILERIGDLVEAVEDGVDELEELVITGERHALRTRLSDARRQSIALRRYLVPQRDTIVRLHTERVDWISDLARARLRELADRMFRFVETIDASRERAAVTHEELNNVLAEEMNRTMYTLSIVAAIFLPLGLLTGLLGINVGGMPGTDSSVAFAWVCVLLVALAIVEWLWFRRMRLV